MMLGELGSRPFGSVRYVGIVLLALAVARPSAATWSIVAADSETQEVVVAAATCLPGVDMKTAVPVVVVGEGAGATQADGDPTGARRRAIWDGLHLGWTATDIMNSVVNTEVDPTVCQDGLAEGRYATAATHTGTATNPHADGVTGRIGNISYAIQGNVLAGAAVITAAEAALAATQGDLAERVMAAMEAAQAMGGDGRCSCTPGNPTACGSPPPQFEKSALAGFLIASRLGDSDDSRCDSVGCADGSYFMDLNVAYQDVSDPDPVPQLRAMFDAHRLDLLGRPDAITSTVSFSPVGTAGEQWVMRVDLADWQGTPLAGGVDSLTIEHAPGSSQVTTIGPVVYRGGGRYEATLASAGQDGVDIFLVTADDGIRPVVLPPRRARLNTMAAPPTGEAGSVTVSQSGPGQWHAVALTNTYTHPVVIMQPPSRGDAAPTTVRVRNVSATGFEFQLDEWDYLDGAHGSETVGYLVVEAGRYTLHSGAVLEAGTADVSDAWATVTFDQAYPSTPVVLSQVTTVSEASAVTTRQRAVAPTGFEVRLQEEEAANGVHAAESVGWVAISVGNGQTAGRHFEARRTADAVSHDWYDVTFAQPFASAPVFLAALQTFDGPDTTTTRSRGLTAGGVQLFAEEETSFDTESNHTAEVVGLLAIEAGDLQANTPPVALDQDVATTQDTPVTITLAAEDAEGDALTFAIEDLPQSGTLTGAPPEATYTPYPGFVGVDGFTFTANDGRSDSNVATVTVTVAAASGPALGESGTVTTNQADPTQWHTVALNNAYTNPVVIMQPPSHEDAAPTTVRIRNVSATGFEFQLDEWDYLDGAHGSETVGYLVVEAGRYTLANGGVLEAGTATVSDAWSTVAFGAAFHSTPVVLSQVTTVNEASAVTTRQRAVAPGGFEVRLQEEEAADGLHAAESVGWVAISAGQGQTMGKRFEARRTPDAVSHVWYEVDFSLSLTSAPVFLSALQTFDGPDTATTRCRGLTAGGVQLFVEEETSFDTEPNHTAEVVGFLAIEAGDLQANTPPVALDQDVTTEEGVAVTITLTADDADGDVLTFAIVDGPQGGALTGTPPEMTYTPNGGFVGVDSFTFTATDGRSDSNVATVTVTVTASSGPALGESGRIVIDQADSTEWHTVALNHVYTSPVVIMQPPTFNESDQSTIRIRSVSADSFQFQIDEWECRDGTHDTETMGYLVIEAGEHMLADGTKVKAGTVPAGDALVSVSFGSVFGATPVVLTQSQTVSESTAVATRQQDIGASGFKVRLQEQEAEDGVHAAETVGWVAIDVHAGASAGLSMEVGRTGDAVYHDWQAITFTQSYSSEPVFLAGMQTTDGPDTASLRCRDVTIAGAEVFVEEEDSYDAETAHTTEVVGFIAMEAGELVP